MKQKHILLIAYQNSVVVRGIEKKLGEKGFSICTINGQIEKVRPFVETDDIFIIYLSGIITEDAGKLMELIPVCNFELRDVIIIGEKKYREDLVKLAPVIGGKSWLDRPLDMDKLLQEVDNLMLSKVNRESKFRILIVDDDPAYAKMVREWLKDTYTVDIVTAGMQAITFLMKNEVNLILLDYEMPVVDGPQVLQMLRSEPTTADIPVVFLTGVGTRESVERVMALKPRGYVLKTTTKAELIKKIAPLVKYNVKVKEQNT